MEIFGGLLILVWMTGFFLSIIWFITPFVIFGIKARTDETLVRIKDIDSRLSCIEQHLSQLVADSRQRTE
jgi:hypothetical protein